MAVKKSVKKAPVKKAPVKREFVVANNAGFVSGHSDDGILFVTFNEVMKGKESATPKYYAKNEAEILAMVMRKYLSKANYSLKETRVIGKETFKDILSKKV